MQAKNFHYSKVLRPLPLFIIFVIAFFTLDWIYPDLLSRFSFLIILVCGVLFGFLPKQSASLTIKTPKTTKEANADVISPLEAAPKIFKFKTFLNFQELLRSALEETIAFIENLPPSSISIFAHLSSKNQRYPISLGSFMQQIKDLSLPLFIHPVFSIPQKKLSFNKLEIFLSVPEKKQTISIKKLDVKTSPEYRAYVDLAILLSIFKKIVNTPQKLRSAPYFCEIQKEFFEYPTALQTLKDIINHPDFPKHLFTFIVSPETVSENTAILENWHDHGFQIIMHAYKLPARPLPSFLQIFYIDLPDLRSSLKGLAQRQFNHVIQTLTEQPYKVILGEVEDMQILQDILPAQFDFACGSAFSEIQLCQDSTIKK